MAKESEIKDALKEIQNDLKWHWRAICGIGGAVLFLFGWIFIKTPEQNRQALSGLKHQLAILSANVQLTQPDAGKNLPNLMKENLSDPDHQLAFNKVAALAEIAQQRKIPSDPAAIGKFGQSLLEDKSSGSPNGWDALIKVANYKSSITPSPPPSPDTHAPPPDAVPLHVMKLRSASGKRLTEIVWGSVPAEQGCFVSTISEYQQRFAEWKERHPQFPEWCQLDFIDGADIRLDGLYQRKLIVKNARVIYHGGPIELHDVYFVDCTFEVDQTENSRKYFSAFFTSSELKIRLAS